MNLKLNIKSAKLSKMEGSHWILLIKYFLYFISLPSHIFKIFVTNNDKKSTLEKLHNEVCLFWRLPVFASVHSSVSVIIFLWFLVSLLLFAVHPPSPVAYQGYGLLGLFKCQRLIVSLNMWRNSRQEICFQRYFVTIPS